MKESRSSIPSAISRTAHLVAAYRARAAQRSNSICHDHWASMLASDEGLALSHTMDAMFPHGELWIALRTAFLDLQVRRLIGSGIRQVVILGAGLDTRAVRLAAPNARFFEVDQARMQDEKLERLAQIASYPKDAATYVACHFEEEDFLAQLLSKGFDSTQASAFVWEGVVYYLSEEAVRGTLSRIAAVCDSKTVILFDYLGKRLVEGRVREAADRAVSELVADLGEPFRFGIDDPIPLLHASGYKKVRHATFDEIALNFTGTYERGRKFRFQGIVMASPEFDFDK